MTGIQSFILNLNLMNVTKVWGHKIPTELEDSILKSDFTLHLLFYVQSYYYTVQYILSQPVEFVTTEAINNRENRVIVSTKP